MIDDHVAMRWFFGVVYAIFFTLIVLSIRIFVRRAKSFRIGIRDFYLKYNGWRLVNIVVAGGFATFAGLFTDHHATGFSVAMVIAGSLIVVTVIVGL